MTAEEMRKELEGLFKELEKKSGEGAAAATKQIGELKQRLDEFEAKSNRSALPGGQLDGTGNAGKGPRQMTPEMKSLDLYIRSGQIERKAMGIAEDPAGGYEVPVQLDSELQRIAANKSAILQVCKVVQGVGDGYAQNVVTGLPASGWVGESATRSATATPTISQITFARGGCYANASASNWFLQDGTTDVAAWLVEEIGRSFGAALGLALAAGDGLNRPKGVTQYTHATSPTFGQIRYVASGDAGKPTLDGALSALMSLHPEYQQNATFIMSLTAALALRAQKASTAGMFLWSPDAKEGTPPMLFGRPVLIDVSLPAVEANSLSVYVADWRRAYTCVRYGQPIMVRDPISTKGSTLFYLEQRVGGGLTDSNAIVAVKSSTA